MLVLSRRAGQSFWIDDETEVIVMGYQGNTIKLGVRAPRHVRILRNELKVVAQQNEVASGDCSETRLDILAARFRSPES